MPHLKHGGSASWIRIRVGNVAAKRLSKSWQVGFDDVANDLHVDPEVLMDEDVPAPADLRPRDLRVRVGDLRG